MIKNRPERPGGALDRTEDQETRQAVVAIGVVFVVTAALIILKLGHVFVISWVWALCPIWIPFAAADVFLVVVALLALTGRPRQ